MPLRTILTASPILLLLGLLQGCTPSVCTWSWHDGVPIGDRCVPCPEGTTLQSSIEEHSSEDEPRHVETWCSDAEGVAHGPESDWVAQIGPLSVPIRSGMNEHGTPVGAWSFRIPWDDPRRIPPGMVVSIPMVEGRPHGQFVWTHKVGVSFGQYFEGQRHGLWLLQEVGPTFSVCYDGRAEMTLRPVAAVKVDARLPECPASNPIDGPFRVLSADGAVEAEGAYLNGVPHGAWRARPSRGGMLDLGGEWASGNFVDGRAEGEWTWTSEAGEVLMSGELRDGQQRGVWTTRIPLGIRRTTWSDDGTFQLMEYLNNKGQMYGRACHRGAHVLWKQETVNHYPFRSRRGDPKPLPAPPFACTGTPTVDKPQSNLPSRPHAP